MGILDEAIREHLELKRQHGADDSELKQLEDQAFGPPERPGAEGEGAGSDAAAEAPTEFMAQPDLADGEPQAGPSEEALNQEPPPVRREPAAGMADLQEAPATAEEQEDLPAAEEEPAAQEEPAAEEEPVAEEQPAAEHEAIPDPRNASASHSTEERHAIADQPTQMYDVEEEFASTGEPAPPDEDLVAEEMTEARLGPAQPLPPAQDAAEEDDEDDDFFDEQRLSDELDQALEAPLDPEPAFEEEPEPAVAHVEEPEPDRDEDVLEETPDFLEETPEDDELWFEQKPPKDFDFDD